MELQQEKNKLTEEQKRLIENNLDFCYYWMNLHNIKDEDVQQSLLASVCSFIHLYDPNRGTITTFLSTVLNGAISKLIRKENTQSRIGDKYSVNIEDVISESNDDTLTWGDIIEYKETGFEQFEAEDYCNDLIKYVKKITKMNPKKIDMLIDYINIGNMAEVAKMYGCTHQNVSRVCNEVKLKLKIWKKVYDKTYC